MNSGPRQDVCPPHLQGWVLPLLGHRLVVWPQWVPRRGGRDRVLSREALFPGVLPPTSIMRPFHGPSRSVG